MTKFLLLFFTTFFFATTLSAQVVADSNATQKDTVVLPQKPIVKDSTIKKIIHKKDSSFVRKDSSIAKKDSPQSIKPDTTAMVSIKKSIAPTDSLLFKKTLISNAYFNFYGKIKVQDMQVHKTSGSDGLFYLLLALWFYFGLARIFFWKYLNTLFALFFRASMRQPQMREQALQAPLPSLLLNILFILNAGLYACFFVRYYHFAQQTEFWLLYIYCTFAMVVIYLLKFSLLKICGWVFNMSKGTDNYIFIVFLVNKILGITLLPFLTLLAFSAPVVIDISITVSLVLIFILFIYRFIACFGAVRSEIKLTVFHYFLYLCAFEIAPLLLIYKIVLSFLNKAY